MKANDRVVLTEAARDDFHGRDIGNRAGSVQLVHGGWIAVVWDGLPEQMWFKAEALELV